MKKELQFIKNKAKKNPIALGIVGLLSIFAVRSVYKAVTKPTAPKNPENLTDSEALAYELYKSMKGASTPYNHEREAVFQRYNLLPDPAFINVAKVFQKKYGKGETLKDWIQAEYYFWYSHLHKVVKRMNNMNMI